MPKDRVWYVHTKTTDTYMFVVRNCQGFDQDTDFWMEAPVQILDSSGEKYETHRRDLIQINWDMVQKLKNSTHKSGRDYEVYVRENQHADIALWVVMYNFKEVKKNKPKIITGKQLLEKQNRT